CQRQLMRDDPRRVGSADMDEVAQVAVVTLDRTLSAAHVLALAPENAVVKHHLAVPLELVWAARILRYEHPHDADAAREAHGVDEVVQGHVGMLVPLGVMRLVTDTLT